MRLDDYLARSPPAVGAQREDDPRRPAAKQSGRHERPSVHHRRNRQDDCFVRFRRRPGDARMRPPLCGGTSVRRAVCTMTEFQFDHVTAKPLSRETWLAHATRYRDANAGRDWILVTAMPEAFYLEGLRMANSRSAMVFALASGAFPCVGGGAGIDGDLAAPARGARDKDDGSRGAGCSGSRQQSWRSWMPLRIVQRHGDEAEAVV